MVACIDDGFRAADARVLAPTRTHFTHPTKVNDAATHINRLRRMGGARQIRPKNGNVHRAQPIMGHTTAIGHTLNATRILTTQDAAYAPKGRPRGRPGAGSARSSSPSPPESRT
ncbi:hypothetical protein G6F31_016807 [Rhizopus arrhizus]|nr:hypothetical protein G6F31_016807 [Rhizopus arrhizus]